MTRALASKPGVIRPGQDLSQELSAAKKKVQNENPY
jgi:hypothetical protein